MLLVAAMRQSVLGVLVGAMLSPLPLAMVAFGLGAPYLPVAVVSGAVTVTVMTGSFAVATMYLAMDAAPVAVLSRLGLAAALAGGRPVDGTAVGRTVSWLTMAAVLAVVFGLAGISAGPDGIEATLRAQVEKALAALPAPSTTGPGADFAAAQNEMLRTMAGFLPGLVALGWCWRAVLSAGLGQLMLERTKLALWPTPAYRGFTAPRWIAALFVAAAVAAAGLKNDAGFIAGNAAAVLGLPLALQGLAVVHCAAARLKYRLWWLAAFYMVALAKAGPAAVLLAGLGIVDGILDIRARYLVRRTGGE